MTPWIWLGDIIAIRLLSEESMKKEKVGANEACTKTTFILTQKKFEFKGGRDKIKYICNYCKVSIL